MKKSKRDFVVYVAGPYRANTRMEVLQNIQTAIEVGSFIRKNGYSAIIPHVESIFSEDTLTEEEWLEHGLSLLRRCHAVFDCRLYADMESEGTELECVEAERLDMSICTYILEIHQAYEEWCKDDE